MNPDQKFIIQGGHRLHGTITPQGAKNEALQILCAVMLTEEEVHIKNVPDILDVRNLIDLIKGLGAQVQKITPNEYIFKAEHIDLEYFASDAYQSKARKIRGSVMLLAPLLARFGKAFLPKPGGDKIGRRRLDTHFIGLGKLGATLVYDEVDEKYFLEAEKLKGSYVLMEEISVTGTANMLMASVLAEGETTIYNAACEPYIQQLSKMLVSMGAKIDGIGSNLLRIQGVNSLSGTTHTCLPDMIEIGSFIGLAAMCQSHIEIQNARIDQLGNILNVFRKMGIRIEEKGDNIVIPQQKSYEVQTFLDGSLMTIYDSPWPGFTPDLISILLVVATQAKGSVLIHQKMFESRLFFVDKLIDMGARIILCDPHRATVIGLARESKLRGIKMSSPDIRAGVSLLIAALSAEGESQISNIHQIDRGYQDIEGRLKKLGAHIERV